MAMHAGPFGYPLHVEKYVLAGQGIGTTVSAKYCVRGP
jgi:hypothetical protein